MAKRPPHAAQKQLTNGGALILPNTPKRSARIAERMRLKRAFQSLPKVTSLDWSKK